MENNRNSDGEYNLYDIDGADWRIPAGYLEEFTQHTRENPDYKDYYIKKDYLRLAARSLIQDSEVPPEFLERISSLYGSIGDIEPSESLYGEINKLRNSISYRIKKCIANLDFETQRQIISNRPVIKDLLLSLEPEFQELIGNPQPQIGQNESFRLMPQQFQQELVLNLNDFVNELREDIGITKDELYEELRVTPWNIQRNIQRKVQNPSTIKKEEPLSSSEKYTLLTADFINENLGLLYRARMSPAKEALKELYSANELSEVDVMEHYGFAEQETVTATKGKNMIDEVLLNLVDQHSSLQQAKYRCSKIQWFKNIFDTNQSGPAKVLAKFYGQMSGIKLFKLESSEEVLTNFGMSKETQDSLEKTDIYLLKFMTKSTGKKPVTHLVPVCIASAPPSAADRPIKVRQYALTAKSEYLMELSKEISKNQAILAREVMPIFRG